MNTVYLSLGSNLGDRRGNLRQAIEGLTQQGVRITRVSALYETEPRDVAAQPWFLNQVVECETEVTPAELLRRLQRVERQGGRVRRGTVRRGPRLIDIDILLFADRVIHAKDLEVPHSRLTQRRFALQPLLELNPNLVHPGTREPLAQYLAGVEDQQLRLFIPRRQGEADR